MAQRGSKHEDDEIVWATTGVRLGTTGLDLRQPSDPGALTELLNARFIDDRTVRPRDGHYGVLIKDGAEFAAVGPNYSSSGEWVYGHGQRVGGENAAAWENAHHPIPKRGAGIFSFDDTDVIWTGDRLLMATDEGAALGQSSFWQRSSSTTALPHGIPAYLPLQTDSSPPASVTGDYIETCLTETLRVIVDTTATTLTARIINRASDVIINQTELSGASNAPVEPKVFQSGQYVVVLWRDSATEKVYRQYWNGNAWSGATELTILADCLGFDVAPVSGGFHVLWRTAVTMKMGKFSGISSQSTPYAFATQVDLAEAVPSGPCALGVSPTGEIGIVAEDTNGLHAKVFSSTLEEFADIEWVTLSASETWDSGLSICSRGLKEANGYHNWVVHASRGSDTGVGIYYLRPNVGTALEVAHSGTRHNSCLASKSFRCGDEVFCWLRAANAGTHYLLGGAGQYQVCGYADRYEAITRAATDGNYAIPHVLPDPLDEENATFSWVRPFNTGQAYDRGGNVRLGDIDFLAPMCSAQYGKSVYLSGSAVRSWDGVTLGDAGFQNYPVIASYANNVGVDTAYYWRVYAVRYNAKGERFVSPAVSYGPVVASFGFGDGVDLTINTLPDTNHDDVIFEVYRTEDTGTTFYLSGTVANSLSAATVNYRDEFTDALIISEPADPHAAGVGALSELEEGGPLGCSLLAVAGDRLWGAGGQVTAGMVQFSKLREEGEGAGFDSLAGFQVVDSEGGVITSIAGQNDATAVFQQNQIHILAGTGPDNYGRGAFNIPQIKLADGAINHAGTVLTQLGTLYWGQEGPRLLSTGFAVMNISAPVRPLTSQLAPSGVVVDLSKQEVVWYTSSGEALLWNYLGGNSRWAQWSGLKVAGSTSRALVTTDGRRLIESPDAVGDDGQSIKFVWTSGNLRADQLLQGAALVRAAGVVGSYEGPHNLRMRIYYNGSPLWTDQHTWEPADNTYLASGTTVEDLTPAEIDAMKPTDRSGSYMTHKRTSRQGCHFFRVQVSNLGCDGPSYVPFELSLELGARGGLGRVPINTFTTTTGR